MWRTFDWCGSCLPGNSESITNCNCVNNNTCASTARWFWLAALLDALFCASYFLASSTPVCTTKKQHGKKSCSNLHLVIRDQRKRPGAFSSLLRRPFRAGLVRHLWREDLLSRCCSLPRKYSRCCSLHRKYSGGHRRGKCCSCAVLRLCIRVLILCCIATLYFEC